MSGKVEKETNPPSVIGDPVLRNKIIYSILNDDNFVETLKNDLTLKVNSNVNKNNLAIKLNKYAVKNGFWKENVSSSTLVKDFTAFEDKLPAVVGTDPRDLRGRGNRILRHKIIEDIIKDSDFIKNYVKEPLWTTKAYAIKINEYAVKYGIWSEGIAVRTIINDLISMEYQRIRC